MDPTLPLLTTLTDRSATGVALAIGRLISTGTLAPGDKLPSIRAVADELGLSPTTVSESWRILQGHGAIETEGRRGTFVRGPRQGAAPGRYWQVPVDPGTFATDLSTGTPDPQLLPPLGPILSQVTLDLPVTSYLDAPVLPELGANLRMSWPFEPELLTIVDGAQDGLDRLVQALVNVGDCVVVNEPAFPPLLDMFDQAGARVIGVSMDDEGCCPESLSAALAEDPVVFFLQPRAHNPTGITMTKRRAKQLASLLETTTLTVVEDDHSADVSGADLASLGQFLPERVVHIRSFSKSHGPDLRLAAVGGAAAPIDTMVRRRRLGPSWSSRLLQQVLLNMLHDPETCAAIDRAQDEYLRRRRSLVEALAARDIAVGGDAGLNLWVPVIDEQNALVVLAANGFGASPGEPFSVAQGTGSPHIRVSIGAVDDGIDELADVIARAATTPRNGPRS